MIVWAAFRTQNHRPAHEVFDDSFDFSVVEQIADSYAAAHLWGRKGRSHLCCDVLECSIALVEEEQFGLQISRIDFGVSHLRVDVAVYLKEVGPAAIGEIDKAVAPANVSAGF